MVVIDIGEPAINRSSAIGLDGYTIVSKGNPANGTGIITTIEIYADVATTGVRVGTFYATNGNTLKCRDSQYIGNIVHYYSSHPVTLDVVTGDYIGIYFTDGSIDLDADGSIGAWRIAGYYIEPGYEATYRLTTTWRISFCGTGSTILPPTVTTQAADNIGIGAGTLHDTITATGGENASERGFDYDYDSGVPYASSWTETNSYGVGPFEKALSGLTQGVTVYFRAKAQNPGGWGYGGE
ncbi:unnamed protein product, partial [marine sediment metagenome]